MTDVREHDGHGLTYAHAIERDRAGKDEWFRGAAASPIPPAERGTFTGLPYFAVDEDLRFEGLALEPYAGQEPSRFAIPTSDGQLRPAHRAGTFAFVAGGVPCRLTAYVLDGGHAHSLFVPFLDETSGEETYGAGRYLDVEARLVGEYKGYLDRFVGDAVRSVFGIPGEAGGRGAGGPVCPGHEGGGGGAPGEAGGRGPAQPQGGHRP